MLTNTAAERLLLALCYRHHTIFFQFAEHLTEEDFANEGHRQIFLTIHHLYMEEKLEKLSKAKLMMAARTLGFANFLSVTKEGAVLDNLATEQVEVSESRAVFLAVKTAGINRQYDDVARDVTGYVRETPESPTEVIREVEAKVLAVGNGFDFGSRGPIKLGETAEETIKDLADNPGHLGLDLGLPIWQHRIGQLRNGAITFVVATAKAGKSQFALRNALYGAHKLRVPVIYLDSELNKMTQQVRMVGMLAKVPYEILETGFWQEDRSSLEARGLDGDYIDRIIEAGKRMKDPVLWNKVRDLPITYLPIAGMSVTDVIPHIRRWLMTEVKPDPDAKFPECLIVYDYIKLATVEELRGGKVAEWQVHGLNVSALHDFAEHYNVPVMAFGQTNRELTDSINCVAGGKRIEENVDSITLMKRKSDEERGFDPDGSHYLKVFASRHGSATEVGHINYQADLSCGNYEELDYSTVNFAEERRKRVAAARQRRSGGGGGHSDDDDHDDDD